MTEAELIARWAVAFALTLAVEVAVATPLLASAGQPLGRRLALVTIAQFSTHPIVWFVLPAFYWPRLVFLFVAETWAVSFEALVYRTTCPALPWKRAALVALAANATSFLTGLVVRALTSR